MGYPSDRHAVTFSPFDMSKNAVGALQEFTARRNSEWEHPPKYIEFAENGYKLVLTRLNGTELTFTVEANEYRKKKEAKQAVAQKALRYVSNPNGDIGRGVHAPRRVRVPAPTSDPEFAERLRAFPLENGDRRAAIEELRQLLSRASLLLDTLSEPQ